MSATKTILMQDDNRGESPRRQPRLPAIAPKDDQSSTSSSRSGRVPGPAVPHRQRLPPRSRTGCWTCRHRKVKCDEGRPICGQCARLGHACDYSPRLSFRDDTQRVVERMHDVTVAGSTVWNGQSTFNYHTRRAADASVGISSPAPSSAGSAIADDLPPFPSLTTDEERERKAEASSPGTYNVVVNPDSFQHLPEYSDDIDIKREKLLPLRRGSVAASMASSFGRESTMEGVPVRGDPNTIILPRFEDLSRRSTREPKSPISPTGPIAQQLCLEDTIDVKIKEEEGRNDEELRSLEHFRTVVWKHLVPTEDPLNSSFALVERIAADFRPLFHAMLAVAFQSNQLRDGRENFDALQHYDLAIEHLKREEDLSSDGVFLTHFLMLIYEIATANVEHSHIRTHHVNALLRITHLRRQTHGGESFPYIIWWICNIDLDNLISGVGNAGFVAQMLVHDVVPPPSFHLYPLGSDGSSVVYAEERESLPTVLQLDYDITLLAVRLVTLSQEFRSDNSFGRVTGRQRDMTVRLWQSRLYEIQEALRRLWLSPAVMTLAQIQLPTRPRRVWDRAFTLYRACIIFSHTSMWPAQHLDTPFEFEEELALASSEILSTARSIIHEGHLECRFLVFPLFIAGFASINGGEKQMALDLVTRMEQESIGRNTSKTRRALTAIYERQNERFLSTGHSLDIDWMDVMAEQGLSVVSFGM